MDGGPRGAHLGPVDPVEAAGSGGCGEGRELAERAGGPCPGPDFLLPSQGSHVRGQDTAWDCQELVLQGHSPSRKHHLGDSFWQVGDLAPAPSCSC